MDEELIDRLEAEAEQLKKRLDHLRIERAGRRLNFHQWREFFTTKEKLHAIYLKLTNPGDLVVYDIKVLGFKLGPGTNVKALVTALEEHGFKWEIDYDGRTVTFYRKHGALRFPPRTYDVAVVTGAPGNAVMAPKELKTRNALLNSVKGKLAEGPIEGEFKVRSGKKKLLGGQLETEEWLKRLAAEHKVDAVLLESKNIENGSVVRHTVKPGNLKLSAVTSYEAPSARLFSSLRVAERRVHRNLERARQRQARERARARKAADPRGVSEKGTANKLGAEPRPAPSDATPPLGSTAGAPEPDDLSIRSSSGFLKNLAKGFALEIVKGLVLNALIGPYERELGKVNLEQTARSFKMFILPKVEPVLHGELAHSYEVLFNPDKHVWPADRRYLLVWWYQFTEEQAADVGDVAVWAYRFPEGFAEVFHSVQINEQGPYGSPFANWHGRRPFKRRVPSRTELRRGGKTYYRYSFITPILVWDRDVARLVWALSKVKKVQPEHAKAYQALDMEQRRLFAVFAPDVFDKIAAAVPALRILKQVMQ